jgi:hypothetical protein
MWSNARSSKQSVDLFCDFVELEEFVDFSLDPSPDLSYTKRRAKEAIMRHTVAQHAMVFATPVIRITTCCPEMRSGPVTWIKGLWVRIETRPDCFANVPVFTFNSCHHEHYQEEMTEDYRDGSISSANVRPTGT